MSESHSENAPKRGRGRPKNKDDPEIALMDEVIARTMFQLLSWGLPRRSKGTKLGIAEAIGNAALTILKRSDSSGLALGPERIEQIFELWFAKETSRRISSKEWPMPQRWRYAKETLKQRIPNKTLDLEQLVNILLNNNGVWPEKLTGLIPHGDLELTPSAWEKLGSMPKLK